MLSLCIALLVVGVGHGADFRPLPLVAGVTLGTLVMLLAGFASSLPFDSVSDWFLSTTVPLAILALPVLDLSGVWVSPVLYTIPTKGPLLLFAATFDQLTLAPWQLAYAVLYPLACAAGLYRLAKTLFGRYVIARSGVL